jgi:hypothetical protein
MRSRFRRLFFRTLEKAVSTDDGKALLARSLHGVFPQMPVALPSGWQPEPPPYAELGKPTTSSRASDRSDVIIITGRFRSGSTLLWNLFRNIEGCTSYYEPFNERRWFDPASRGSHIDPTHRHAEEYWREYEGLAHLGEYYREDWIDHNLYMDAHAWDPGMKRYVELMVERAPGRPVLQFNRIDFRLPWFRQNFPNAAVIHLYRHPRDQWCSALMDIGCFAKDAPMNEFPQHDRFYLLSWARDLKYQFPFLDERAVSHPYQLFYCLWKLSYLFGRAYAHHSLAFEHLVEDPERELRELLRNVNITPAEPQKLTGIIERPSLGKWRKYADDEWFRRHETVCETTLADFGLPPSP